MSDTWLTFSGCGWLLLTSSLAWGQAPDESKPVYDVVLVAGQSNSVGYDAHPDQLPPSDSDQQVKFWFRCGDPPPDEFDSRGMGWGRLAPQPKGMPDTASGRPRQYGNFTSPLGGFGPEIGFARDVLKQQPQTKLAVVKASFSGTSLISDWDPVDKGERGLCYQALVQEVRAAVEAAEKQGFACRVRALLWVQGESDAHPDAKERYRDAIVKMVAQLRSDLEAPEMQAFLGVNTRFNGIEQITPAMQAVIAGQQAAHDLDARCHYVDLDGASLHNAYHFDTAGTIDIGQRFAKAYLTTRSQE